MESVLQFLTQAAQFIVLNYQIIITGVMGILMGVITICMLIPGEQPEKFLQGVVDFLAKFSKK